MPVPAAARSHYLWSAALSERAAREAGKVRKSGSDVARIVILHQATAARQAVPAVGAMLSQQGIDEQSQALINTMAFTTPTDNISAMLDQAATDFQFARLVSSLVENAGRAADHVATAARLNVGYVRYLSPPSCSRCAVLAGRVYRYSAGFQRHPRCDCIMVPTSTRAPAFVADPVDLARRGLVTGLSKADLQALDAGANFDRIVNVRQKAAGLSTPGRVLIRAGRQTPEGIFATASSRDDAIERLIAAGYIR